MKKKMTSDPVDGQTRSPRFAFGTQKNSKGMGMRRIAAIGAGLAITLTAFGSFAADQPAATQAPASAQASAGRSRRLLHAEERRGRASSDCDRPQVHLACRSRKLSRLAGRPADRGA